MARLGRIATARQAQLADGRRLGFAEYGDPNGKPVLMMHDLWGTRLFRHPDDNILLDLGVRLIGIDRPGIGMSTRKPDRTLLQFADDVRLLAKALSLDSFALLGYSAGGPYALACAYQLANSVSRCAVVSSLPPMDDPQGFEAVNGNYARLFQIAANSPTLIYLLMKGFFWIDSRRAPDYFITELSASMPKQDQAIIMQPQLFHLRRMMWEEIRQNGSEGFVDELIAQIQSWGFTLKDIQIPVDIWWGNSDTFVAPMVGKRMADYIPESTLHLIENSGHLILFSHWRAILENLINA